MKRAAIAGIGTLAVMAGTVLVVPTAQAAVKTSMPGCSASFNMNYSGTAKGSGKCGTSKWTVKEAVNANGYKGSGKIRGTKINYKRYGTTEGSQGQLWKGRVNGKIGKQKVSGSWKTNTKRKGSSWNSVDSGKVRYKGKTYKFKFAGTYKPSNNSFQHKTASVRNNKGKKLKANNGLRIYLSIIDFRKGSL